MSDLLHTHAAAIYLRITPRTLARWRTKRIGPPWTRLRWNVVLYRVADLDAFLAARKTATKPIGPFFTSADHRPTRRCANCGKTIVLTVSHKRFCSVLCRTTWHGFRHPEWQQHSYARKRAKEGNRADARQLDLFIDYDPRTRPGSVAHLVRHRSTGPA